MSVRAELAERASRPRARREDRAPERERSSDAGLDLLRAVGWLVLHDVALPGRADVQIDHVVAGRSGVCVINTLRTTGSVTLTDDSLACAGLSRIDDVNHIAAAAAAVREELDGAPVVPVLCFDRSDDITGFVAGVAICSTSNILELINGLPDVLSGRQYLGVQRNLTDVLVQSGGRRAVAEPEVAAPPARRFRPARRSKPVPVAAQPRPVVVRLKADNPRRVRRRYFVPAHRKRAKLSSADARPREPAKKQVKALMPAIVGAVVIAAVPAAAPRIPDVVTWARSLNFFTSAAPASLGQPIVMGASLQHPDLTVTAGIPIVVAAVGAVAGKGRHLVAVPLTSLNRGAAPWTLPVAEDLTVVDSLGVAHRPDTTIKRVRSGHVLGRQVGLVPGSALTGLVVFAIPNGRRIGQVWLTLDTESPYEWAAAATSSG